MAYQLVTGISVAMNIGLSVYSFISRIDWKKAIIEHEKCENTLLIVQKEPVDLRDENEQLKQAWMNFMRRFKSSKALFQYS